MIPLRGSLRGELSPVVTYVLLAINVGLYVHEWTLPPPAFEAFLWNWGLVPAREMASGSILPPILSALTSMFVHGGWLHLLGNMLYLWLFGGGLESRVGSARFVAIHFASGIVAMQAQVWFSPLSTLPIIGASGAIAGVLGAYFVVAPRARIKVLFPIWIIPLFFDVPAFVFLGLWFVNQAISGTLSLGAVASSELAWWAHIGGFLAGAILVAVLGVPPPPKRRSRSPYDVTTDASEGSSPGLARTSLRRASPTRTYTFGALAAR